MDAPTEQIIGLLDEIFGAVERAIHRVTSVEFLLAVAGIVALQML